MKAAINTGHGTCEISLNTFKDFETRTSTKAFGARMRSSIKDDFQVQMKTKERAWQQIATFESRFSETSY